MSAAPMAKSKGPKKSVDDAANPNKEVTLKVFPAERDLINKAAGARGESVARLFRSKEVRTFFTHLLADAARTEVGRLEAEGKPKE